MIIVELIFFILISLFTIISFSGFGDFFTNKVNRNFFESFFYGLIIISFLLTFLHFFTKINFYISLPIFLFGFILALRNFKFSTVIINKNNVLYLLIFLILIPIYISQKYHEDFGYYHLPYVVNFVNEKIIFGLANSNKAFVHNSIWLNILPFFYIKDNYNLVTLPAFLIYFVFIVFSISQIIKQKENKISCFFLIVTNFYLILKFTRISEFGNDIPAVIFSILSLYNFFRFFEEEDVDKKKNYFFNNFIFASFAILIKFSSIPIILITIYLFFKNYKFLINDIFKKKYAFVYSLCFIFFAPRKKNSTVFLCVVENELVPVEVGNQLSSTPMLQAGNLADELHSFTGHVTNRSTLSHVCACVCVYVCVCMRVNRNESDKVSSWPLTFVGTIS